jgi:hypothetical protein
MILVPAASAAKETPALSPPPPPDANCNTSPNRTLCHFGATFSGEIPALVDCTTFQVDAGFASEARFTRFYNELGEMTKETRHIRFSGTLTNTTTGAAIVYDGSFKVTFDIAAQTVTITGRQGRLITPEGIVDVVLAGRIVTDLSQDPPVDVFVSGPKDFDARACEYLA